MNDQELIPTTTEGRSWFDSASFGMFIHFDQASQLGLDLSWPIVGLLSDSGTGPRAVTPPDYYAHVDEFDPQAWDPAELAERARRAGMRYAVFTAKHHSGWAAWPSRATDLSIASSPFGRAGRDLVREYVDAFRAAGLRIGLYYSLSDWADPDYPAWRAEFAPYAFDGYPRSAPESWDRYLAGMRQELDELLTDYGRIDLLWFDGGWERTAHEWRSVELEKHIRALQPDIVINDRLPGVGDYVTPEQSAPADLLSGPWEACVTMNTTWGYVPDDLEYKTSAALIRTLIESVAGGGALLLNVGPDAQGAIVPQEGAILDDIADWMSAHRESVIGAGPGLAAWQHYGPSTRAGDAVYLHLFGWPDGELTVRGLPVRTIEEVTLLSTGETLAWSATVDPAHARDENPRGLLTIPLGERRPDTAVPVVRVRFRSDDAAARARAEN